MSNGRNDAGEQTEIKSLENPKIMVVQPTKKQAGLL